MRPIRSVPRSTAAPSPLPASWRAALLCSKRPSMGSYVISTSRWSKPTGSKSQSARRRQPASKDRVFGSLSRPAFGVIHMLRIALLPMLAAMALPAFAIDVVTVDQLQQAVTAVHGKSDTEEAQRLGKLELKERLSDARYERLRASLPGEKSRMALLALADASAFLDLPSVDIPATAAPDRAAQVALLAKTAEYMKGAISMLPDFFATRETIFFAGGPAKTSQSAGKNRRDAALQVVSKFAATIRFLGGREEVADEHAEYGKHNPPGQELAVHGVYGDRKSVV